MREASPGGTVGDTSSTPLPAGTDALAWSARHRRFRLAYVVLIASALGVVLFQLVLERFAGLVADELILAVPALAGAALAGSALLLVSASDESLVAMLGVRRIDGHVRSVVNGSTWGALAALGVHYTHTAFTWFPGGAGGASLTFAAVFATGTFRLHRHARTHETYRTFNLVAMLLVTGSLASMSLTPTGAWWARNFSTLGTSDDIAAACFNLAVTVSGAGIVVMSGTLTRGLRAASYGARRGGVRCARALIGTIGICLMGVGLVPIDGATALHNVFACGAGAAFALLASASPLLAKRMPRPLVTLSFTFLAIEVATYAAFDVFGVVNLTVFEIVAFALVFAWLIALVATTHGCHSAGGRSPAAERLPAHLTRVPRVPVAGAGASTADVRRSGTFAPAAVLVA